MTPCMSIEYPVPRIAADAAAPFLIAQSAFGNVAQVVPIIGNIIFARQIRLFTSRRLRALSVRFIRKTNSKNRWLISG